MSIRYNRFAGLQPVLDHRLRGAGSRDLDDTELDRLVFLYDERVWTLLRSLNGGRWRNDCCCIGSQQHRHVDELAGPQTPISVGELRLDLDCPRCRVDSIVYERDPAVARRGALLGRAGFDAERALRHVA